MAARQQRCATAAFEQFIALPENADRRFGLIAGEIVEKMPTQLRAAARLQRAGARTVPTPGITIPCFAIRRKADWRVQPKA